MSQAQESVDQTLERWRAEEATIRSRAVQETAPLNTRALRDLTGLQQLHSMLAGGLNRPSIGLAMDFILVHAEPRLAVFQGAPGPKFYNPMGTVHGGWYAAMLDSALGCSVHASLPAGKGYTTLELKVNLIRALTDKVPLVRAVGKVIHLGGQTATADAQLLGPDGKLYAHGSTTCLVFDLPHV
jgi:uncharacterized protein (TIGR00369 family)